MNVNFSTFASLHWKECAGATLGVTLLVVGVLAQCQIGAFSQISQHALPIAYSSYSLGAILIAGVAIYSYRAAASKKSATDKDLDSWESLPFDNNGFPHDKPESLWDADKHETEELKFFPHPNREEQEYSPPPPIQLDELAEVVSGNLHWQRKDEDTPVTTKEYARRTSPILKLYKQTRLAYEAGDNEQSKPVSNLSPQLSSFGAGAPIKHSYAKNDLYAGFSGVTYVGDCVDTNFETTVDVGENKVCLYGICDGHRNRTDANDIGSYIKKGLSDKLHQSLNQETLTHEVIANAFVSAYVDLSTEVSNKYKNKGATAISLLVTKNFIYVANSGDSRAIFVSDADILHSDPNDDKHFLSVQQLSEDAKSTNERFDRAIKKTSQAGKKGCARMIGNKDIPARPKITSLPRQNGFVILASDGLWEIASTQQVADIVEKHSDRDPQEIAKQLTDYALKQSSVDNITVTVVRIDQLDTFTDDDEDGPPVDRLMVFEPNPDWLRFVNELPERRDEDDPQY